MNIYSTTDFSSLVYWDSLFKIPVENVYPEYTESELPCLVIIANTSEVIGLGVTEDIGEEHEVPGVVKWFNLQLIHTLELKYLFQYHFNNMVFSEEVLDYLKMRNAGYNIKQIEN